MIKLMFYWSLMLVLLSCCLEIRRASEIQFQTLDMSFQYLSSTSVCSRTSTTAFAVENNEYYVGSDLRLHNGIFTQFEPCLHNDIKNMASRLEVVHRYGSCAPTDQNRPVNPPSFAKILANDRLRVKSIQARAKPDSFHKSKNPNKSCRHKTTQIPAQSGDLLNVGTYIVIIGLGTPERRLTLEFDTGSEITWTQCKPCLRHCYRQNDTIFDPSASTTYSNISCSSKDCPQDTFRCYQNTCRYDVYYGDLSHTSGFLSKDKLTVTPTDVFHGFLFGCGQDNNGSFGLTDGLLGLSRGPSSFVNQTANIYGQYFSYCLPPTKNSTGFLEFGKNNKATKKDNDATMIFTPFVPPPPNQRNFPTLYFIEITAISVCGKQLPINQKVFTSAGAIIDSGTEITNLPPAAYNKLSIEFKKQMNKLGYKSAPAYALIYEAVLDTCFDICGRMNTVKVPAVSITFKGNATIDLDASGTLYSINSTYACLAFAGNSDPEDVAVFGNIQQKKFEVVYDVAGGKLGFARNPYCQ